jgi:D-sedoheptulose 7-phosphate isomerase
VKSTSSRAGRDDNMTDSPGSEHRLAAMIRERINGSVSAIASLRDQTATLAEICAAVVRTLQHGATVYTCGNGGSAAQALHLAEELIGRYRASRPPHRAVCLNADPTALTCIANDFGFDQVFARQCRALLQAGDALVAFSTSGNSENVLKALRVAKQKGSLAIGLLGRDGGGCRAACDIALVIPFDDSAFIQDAHQVALHVICEAVEGIEI